MKAWLKYAQPLALATAAAVLLGACDEKLEGGTACPLLCPQQQALVREDTLFAVTLDTSIAGYPGMGQEVLLFLASMGDTLQTRGVLRYDSLSTRFFHKNSATDSAIVSVDSSSLRLTVVRGDTVNGPAGTVEAYDVDLGGADDADPAAVTSAFTPDRLLGTKDFTARDTLIDVPVDPAKLLPKLQATFPANRLRVGLRVTGASGESTHLSIRAVEGNAALSSQLKYRPQAGDTSVALLSIFTRSMTPDDQFIANDLRDYLVVSTPPPAPPADVLRVGGLPGYRPYLRFDIPSRIIDSSNVVRATLVLTQRPNGHSPGARDTIALEPFAVTASPSVTDLSKALLFLIAPPGTDSVRLVPADSGSRSFEVIRIVKLWAATTTAKTPRAISLHSTIEGLAGNLVDFYSMEAPISVRPRLRITYLPRQSGGIP